MAREKYKDSFWLSYSDLMTSLFFIMLVLFVVCISKMKYDNVILEKERNEANARKEQLEQILQLNEQFKELSASSTLRYDETHKTFVAKDFEGIEIFKSEDDKIKEQYLSKVNEVGKDLESLLKKLHSTSPQFQYLLVIEGNSANNGKWDKDRSYNYDLSFRRAMELYNTWKYKTGIDLRKYNTEIMICGSGLNGINRDNKVEENNKRFVIQIIPKISKPK